MGLAQVSLFGASVRLSLFTVKNPLSPKATARNTDQSQRLFSTGLLKIWRENRES